MNSQNFLIFLLIMVFFFGIFLRTNGISDIGFANDEETSTMAALGIQENGTPHFPSGMSYYRGLLHSYLLHFIFTNFGVGELQARFPSIVFGIGLIFVCIYIGYLFIQNINFALICGIISCLNLYFIEEARIARMYSPFLFFHGIYLIFAIRYFKFSERRDMIWATVLFVVSIFFSELGIFGIVFMALQFFLKKSNKHKKEIIVFCIIVCIAWLILQNLINWGFDSFINTYGVIETKSITTRPIMWLSLDYKIIFLTFTLFMSLLIFSILSNRKLFTYHVLPAFLLFIMGFVHLGWIFLVLLVLMRNKIGKTELIAIIFGIISTLLYLVNNYLIFESINETIKHTFLFPHFVEAFYIRDLPVFLLSLTILYIFANKEKNNLYFFVFFGSFLSIYVIGFFEFYLQLRYLSFLAPLMPVMYSFALYKIVHNFSNIKVRLSLSTFILIVILLEIFPYKYFNSYLDVRYGSLSFTDLCGRPDHKGAALYVKDKCQDSDIVVAVDALQVKYYLGKVDYFLRRHSNISVYSFRDRDGILKDIYTGSKIITNMDDLRNIITKSKTLWLIDSGETFIHPLLGIDYDRRKDYLEDDIIDFLNNSKAKIVYKGKDGFSNVYKF